MGKIKQGILGGFSGRVGTVVGCNRQGASYMRALPQNMRNPRTDKQMSQRTRFALVSRFLQPLTPLLRVGWKLHADHRSASNATMSYALANAITGNYPNYAIDASKVLVSRGALTPAAGASVVLSTGQINITWTDNSGIGAAKQTDHALVAVFNSAKGEAITLTDGAERMMGRQIVPLPAHWTGDSVETYIGFISEDGREVSNSLHLGTLAIA